MYFLPTFHIPISKLDWIFIKTLYLHLNIFPSLPSSFRLPARGEWYSYMHIQKKNITRNVITLLTRGEKRKIRSNSISSDDYAVRCKMRWVWGGWLWWNMLL
jgi:hypothetical protein